MPPHHFNPDHDLQVEGGDLVGMKAYYANGSPVGDATVKLSGPKIFRDGVMKKSMFGTLDLNSASPITVTGIRWGKLGNSGIAECGNA